MRSDWVQPGTHITAVGADAPGKQELDVALVAKTDVLVADLISQCLDHGELSHAAKSGLLKLVMFQKPWFLEHHAPYPVDAAKNPVQNQVGF